MQRSLARPVRLCCRRTYVSRTAPVCAAEPVAPPSAEQKEQRLAANQLRTAGSLLSALAPHVRSNASLALRVRDLAGERRFNSSSRRLYRELLFAAVRHWAWVETLLASGGQSGESNAAAAVAYLADETPEVRRLRSANEASLAALGARSGRVRASGRRAVAAVKKRRREGDSAPRERTPSALPRNIAATPAGAPRPPRPEGASLRRGRAACAAAGRITADEEHVVPESCRASTIWCAMCASGEQLVPTAAPRP